MTDAERRLRSVLRDRRLSGFKFRRQYPFDCYILDFACLEVGLAVEADGSQHIACASDESRTAMLTRHGWQVLRFPNSEILSNTEGVAQKILQVLQDRSEEV